MNEYITILLSFFVIIATLLFVALTHIQRPRRHNPWPWIRQTHQILQFARKRLRALERAIVDHRHQQQTHHDQIAQLRKTIEKNALQESNPCDCQDEGLGSLSPTSSSPEKERSSLLTSVFEDNFGSRQEVHA